MPVSQRKMPPSKFPLRLMPYVRQAAEEFSQRQGVSLNQFINVAVAEKLAHLRHEQWLESRSKPTAKRIAHALAILDRPTGIAPDPDDLLPEGYVSSRRTGASRRAKKPRRAA
jgi:hypothetical protein